MFQISLLAIAGVIGTLLRQLPSFALHDPAAYAQQMAEMHAVYDSLTVIGLNIGPGMVDVFERVGFFRVFSAPWFVFLLTLLVVSIIVCTLDRTPNLWRTAHNVKVVQAAPFYDLRLAERARFAAVDDAAAAQLTGALRGRHFRIRQETTETDDGGQVLNVYGDRNQYFKLATLFTHLGLILFLAGGAVTVGLGYETVVFLGEGQTAPVQAVGTPDNLLVKNIHFEAPTDAEGRFTDFRTDLAVYQNGQEVARKVIRVNDPLEVNGFVFHQNTFGPAEQLQIHDASGKLVWDGPVLLAGELAGLPQGFLTIPGSDIGLLVVLHRNAAGEPLLALTGHHVRGSAGWRQHRLPALARPRPDERTGHDRWLRGDLERRRRVHRHGHQEGSRPDPDLARLPEPDHRIGAHLLFPAPAAMGANAWRSSRDGDARRSLRGRGARVQPASR